MRRGSIDVPLLTGFGPFPGVEHNPTQVLIEHFARQPDLLPLGTRLALLDVDYRAVGPQLDALLAPRPVAVVLTGFSAQATAITLESQASMQCAADKPDVAGFVPDVAGGPPLRCDLDLPRLQGLVQHETACTISHDAGQYLCNFAYAHVLNARLAVPVLFVHIPAIAGTRLAETSAAALPLDTMARALALIVAKLAYSPPL
jgi:pyroglutamyl-peptidase